MDRSDQYIGGVLLICMTDKQQKDLEKKFPGPRKYTFSALDLKVTESVRAVFTDVDNNVRRQKIEAYKTRHELRLQLRKEKETVVQWIELAFPLNPTVTEEMLNDYRAHVEAKA